MPPLCRSLGDVATAAELRERGCTRADIDEALVRGALLRARRGTYASAGLAEENVAALNHGGQLCCASIARRLGLWVLEPQSSIHVWLGPNGRAHSHDGCRCVVHRDVHPVRRGSAVTLVHALAQLLTCLGQEAFFAALESALRQRKLTRRALSVLKDAVPATHRWLVDLAGSDADSGLESLLRLRLYRLGISVASQVRISGVGVVDFVVGDRLILEADGSTHEGEGRHRDLRRDAIALSLGFVTLRYDYALIVHEWDVVEDAILAALRLDLHRTSTATVRTIDS